MTSPRPLTMSFDTAVFINTDMVFRRVAAQSEITLSSDTHSVILFYEQAWNRHTRVSPRHSAVYDFKIFFSIDFCNNILSWLSDAATALLVLTAWTIKVAMPISALVWDWSKIKLKQMKMQVKCKKITYEVITEYISL